MTPPTPLIQ